MTPLWARQLLVVPLLASSASCGLHGRTVTLDACQTQIEALRNDSQVAAYQAPLAASCTSYSQFTQDYDNTKHESSVAPFVVLTFCSPDRPAEVPDAVYDSTLCTSARSQDPQLSALVPPAGSQTDASTADMSDATQPSAPPARSFAGKTYACGPWRVRVVRVDGDETNTAQGVNGYSMDQVNLSVVTVVTNTSKITHYADLFSLAYNNGGGSLSGYGGIDVPAHGHVDMTFDGSGQTVGGDGLLSSIDGLAVNDGSC